VPRFGESEAVEGWGRWQAGDAYRLIGPVVIWGGQDVFRVMGWVRPEPRRRSPRICHPWSGRRSFGVWLCCTSDPSR
jgi:hypothetical protein